MKQNYNLTVLVFFMLLHKTHGKIIMQLETYENKEL